MDSELLTAARAWFDAGYAVIPSHPDGSKRPFGPWKSYQTKPPTWEEIEGWLSTGDYTGIGVICGKSSGNAELIEIEGPGDEAVQRLNKVLGVAGDAGLVELVATVARGCVEQSAGGGLHMFVRVSDGPAKPNTKLAMQGTGTERHVIAETRGEGGFVIVAPTPARKGHKEGSSYLFLQGSSPSGTPTVTASERDEIHNLLIYALDEYDPTTPAAPPVTGSPVAPQAVDGTFGDYRERVTWESILAPQGWTYLYADNEGRSYWTRPGKDPKEGASATTVEDGPMYVFSTSTTLPSGQGMSKEYVYAHLHHSGDLKTASAALRGEGYGPAAVTYDDLPAWTGPVTVETLEDAPPDDPYTLAVQRKVAELRVIDDARQVLASIKAGQAPALDAITLPDLLAQPDEEVRYRVDGLWPAEGRVMLAAAAKSGKTTMVAANLIPALVDGRPFLGQRPTAPISGNVVLLNMEVGEGTIRRWLRDCPIDHPERVIIANLRGRSTALALASDAGRKRFAEFLKRTQAEAVILDPLAPVLASLGLNEDSNAEVALFYSYWSEALALAGVSDDLIVHHTGHAGQRSRGASRLLDEPDAVWTLTKDSEEGDEGFSAITPTRYLAAYGRDVDMAPEALSFDMATRSLTLTGMGRSAVQGDKVTRQILAVFSDERPRTTNQMATDSGVNRNRVWELVKKMAADGDLEPVGKSHNGHPTYLPATVLEGK